jgi:ribonuclease BN (tRNA processing enzyme)
MEPFENFRDMKIRGPVGVGRSAAVVALAVMIPQTRAAAPCGSTGLALEILGSGGGFASSDRAEASYLLWKDGRASLLIDIGGGAALRFGRSGARLRDLDAILLTHLHPDHTSDLPALLWYSNRSRSAPLPLVGPSGNAAFPGSAAFLARLFGPNGAFGAMAAAVDGTGNSVRLQVTDVNPATGATLMFPGAMKVVARGVPHGNVPALAYRVEADGRSIVFGGDQTGTDEGFTEFARRADILVMPLGPSAKAPPSAFLASPQRVGEIARDAEVKRLVLAHFIRALDGDPSPQNYSLGALKETVAAVRRFFKGSITVSSDQQCVAIP